MNGETSRFDPAQLIGLTVCAYWFCVGVMVFRVRRRARKLSNVIVPRLPIERLMWLIWVPLIAAWMSLPFISAVQNPETHPYLALPRSVVTDSTLIVGRWVAAGIGVLCLLLSILCWAHMGRDWRMGIDPAQKTRLIIDGPFAWVRHPIYSLSILLMMCTWLAVPILPVLVMLVLHISLMHMKAHNEERHMRKVFGESYVAYCRQTGRFFPRFRKPSTSVLPGDVPGPA